jgi:hypothetical protein
MRPGTPQHRRRRVAVRHVDQYARADLDPPPGLDVAGESQLVAGTTRVIAVWARVQDPACPLLEVGDRPRLAFRDSLVD